MNDNPDRIAATNTAYAAIVNDQTLLIRVNALFGDPDQTNMADRVEHFTKMITARAAGRWFDHLLNGGDPDISRGPHAEDRRHAHNVADLFHPATDWDAVTRRIADDNE